MSMAKSCIRNCSCFDTHVDCHGFSGHSGGVFSGIMPLILYRRERNAPLLPTKPFLLLLVL